MKIFGKRKREAVSDGGDFSLITNKNVKKSSEETIVKSYFDESPTSQRISSNKEPTTTKAEKKLLEGAISIDQIILMDYSQLNAKQRRQLKRHQEFDTSEKKETITKDRSDDVILHDQQQIPSDRIAIHDDTDANDTPAGTTDTIIIVSNDASLVNVNKNTIVKDDEQIVDKNRKDTIKHEAALDGKKAKSIKLSKSDKNDPIIEEILKIKPSEWNSKQRRLMKRYQERGGTLPGENKKEKEWSQLPKEERERREKQRQMQKEASERRASQLSATNTSEVVASNTKRHPLNSERRRANRRKPGKAMQIVERKREAKKHGTR